MKLMTEEIRKQIPPIGAQDQSKDPTVYVKFFCCWNHWTWLAYEFDGKDIFFGYVKGDFDEFGTFSLSELESVKGPMGLKIERDLYFTQKPVNGGVKVYHLAEQKCTTHSLYSRDRLGCQYSILTRSFFLPG